MTRSHPHPPIINNFYTQSLLEKVKESFSALYGEAQIYVKAPGRINLIGEHTDYNEGFVMPAAVDQSICFAVRRSDNPSLCRITSLDEGETFESPIDEIKPMKKGAWQNYILGVIDEIRKTGRQINGFDMVFSGNIPQGAGMSSSAALECGTCFALNSLCELKLTNLEMIKISQRAEHHYAGVKCGIMDQFASMMGQAGQAILLDCRSLTYLYSPVSLNNYSLVLLNSNISHSLANSAYNRRHEECEEGTHELQKYFSEIDSLRDATMVHLEKAKANISDVVYRRCKYVIEENDRVTQFHAALTGNKSEVIGNLLKSAQLAMEREYEITCPEIDFLAGLANKTPGVLGARMMGGGFGGCTLNFVETKKAEKIVSSIREKYLEQFDLEVTVIPIRLSDGVGVIE